MTTITNANGKTRTVKNLGWLFRHHAEIDHFEVRGNDHGFTLRAVLQDGGYFESQYASWQVSLERFWLRSIFEGLRIDFVDCAPVGTQNPRSRGINSLRTFNTGKDDVVQSWTIGYFANQYLNKYGEGRAAYALSYCGPRP